LTIHRQPPERPPSGARRPMRRGGVGHKPFISQTFSILRPFTYARQCLLGVSLNRLRLRISSNGWPSGGAGSPARLRDRLGAALPAGRRGGRARRHAPMSCQMEWLLAGGGRSGLRLGEAGRRLFRARLRFPVPAAEGLQVELGELLRPDAKVLLDRGPQDGRQPLAFDEEALELPRRLLFARHERRLFLDGLLEQGQQRLEPETALLQLREVRAV